ncbi:MAG: hypothetical protein P1V97_32930, partial [Planctomycetota bacterium]|nr:hypothetical protein [Planctomycetota bacterium]
MMIDREIESLKRRLETDPSDLDLRLEYIRTRARSEGVAAYLEVLKDRLAWNETPNSLQDLTIKAVAEHLRKHYDYLETRVYHCPTTLEADLSHRVAGFRHRKTESVLHLLPGGSYTMGSWEEAEEKPVHTVTVDPML